MAYQLVQPVVLVLLLVLITISIALGVDILKPLAPRGQPQLRWQCGLADVLILVLQLATSGAIVFHPDAEFGTGDELAGVALLWSMQSLWWYLGVRLLSLRGIDAPFHRVLTLALLCPLTFGWVLWPMMGFGAIALAPVLILDLALCRLIAKWIAKRLESSPESKSRPPTPFHWLACGVLCVLMSGGITHPFWNGITLGPIHYKTHLRRFRCEVQVRADITEIQKWLAQQGPSSSDPVQPLTLPPCISTLTTRVWRTSYGSIRLTWGGGFGHWGLEVDTPGTRMPPSDAGEYRLPLADGAWVWHEIQ